MMIVAPTLEELAREKLMAEVAHDEQISVWTEEMLTDPRAELYLAAPETYDDGVNCAEAFKALIRELTESVIVRVLEVQSKNGS